MATPLPVTFRASPLPSNFKGTPQQLLDAIVERLSLETQATLALFVGGSVEPSSDSGPWLKDDMTWWVWDVGTGAYIPQPLEAISLRYVIAGSAPDQNDYDVWIETDGTGKAIAIKTYSAAAWHDVYEDVQAGVQAQITSIISAVEALPTVAEMNTAISAAVTAGVNTYPVAAKVGSTQTVVADGTYYVVEFGTEGFDPGSVYSTSTYRYTAPVAGYYLVTAKLQVDNGTATAASMEILMSVFKNGVAVDYISGGTSVASPPGSRWYPTLSGMVQLAAGEYIDIRMAPNDGVVGAGNVAISTNSVMSIHKVQSV